VTSQILCRRRYRRCRRNPHPWPLVRSNASPILTLCSYHVGTVLGLSALILAAGGVLLQFFTILSGAVNSSPINQFYFLEASTSGIPNARDPTRWTFFAICGVDADGYNSNCGNVVPALPFDPRRNFDTDVNLPEQFIG